MTLLTRPVVVTVAGHFGAAFAALCMPPFYAYILQANFSSQSLALAGWYFTLPTLAAAIANPLWGRLGDRIGRRASLIRAHAGLCLSFILTGMAGTPLEFALGLTLQGLLGGTFSASNAFLAEQVAASRLSTLLGENADCFLKLSLNMRITNCIRNNARHELESALTGTRLYRAMKADMQRHFPRFHVLEERAYLSVEIPAAPERRDARHRELENGFGLVVREGLGELIGQGVRPLICAALFGNGEHGRQRVFGLIERFALHHGHALEHAARLWFARYADAAVYPILYLLFEKGVAFEPHMQNTVLGLDSDGAPSHIILRDLELTRLAPKAHALAAALELDPATLEQLCCSDEGAWTRIGYCLFVNNLCEVIATISNGNHALYLALWGVLRNTLQNYLLQFPHPEANRRIQGLLAGEPLPAKGNLLTRFLRQADRQASYLPLYHPLGVVNGSPSPQ